MNKLEIKQLTELQERIDEIDRFLHRIDNRESFSVYVTGNDKLYENGRFGHIYAKAKEIVKDELNMMLEEKTEERDRLVLCIGNATYQPINIVGGMEGRGPEDE